MCLIPDVVQWVQGSGVATTVAHIQSLVWKLPYAFKKQNKNKNKKGKKENCKNSYLISSLLCIFFFCRWSLIFYLIGELWKSYSSPIYFVTVESHRDCVLVSPKERIWLVEPQSDIHSWAKQPLLWGESGGVCRGDGGGGGRGAGPWSCQEYFLVDGICMWMGRCWRGRLGPKRACGTDRFLKGICSCRRELVLENMIY